MRRGQAVFGVILILLGLFFVLDLWLDISAWKLFWPALLILAGVWLIWGVTRGPQHSLQVQEASIPLQGAGRAQVRLEHGAGRLEVGAGAEFGELLNGSFAGGLEHREELEGDTLKARLRIPRREFPELFFPWSWGEKGLDWQVRLAAEIPLSLQVKSGANQAHLDLSALQVHKLKLDTGASSTTLILPAQAGHTEVEIDAGVSSLKIRVPEGVAAQIQADTGLSSLQVDRGRFPKSGRSYRSPDYESAENRVDIEIDAGLGSIQVY
ncbi:MAG: hypothetical protein JXA37_09165 [Chloroflexia bacterium]|nr:hypothetical protein [Chloroflexia bacterium]